MTLDIITSDTLAPVRHGFYGRAGGASSGVFAGLNCGYGSSDQKEAITINRTRVAESLDVPLDQLSGVHQVHSADVLSLTAPPTDPVRADALVTATPGLALSVLTADCGPVLFTDPGAGVVGAAHAGWKGALGGVLEATLDAMIALGAKRSEIRAVLGPTISQKAYEVGPEFLETFLDNDPASARFFAQGLGDRLLFDLPGFILWRLRSAGVAEAEWTRHCTYSTPDRFFSFRRTTHAREVDYGRLIAAIRL